VAAGYSCFPGCIVVWWLGISGALMFAVLRGQAPPGASLLSAARAGAVALGLAALVLAHVSSLCMRFIRSGEARRLAADRVTDTTNLAGEALEVGLVLHMPLIAATMLVSGQVATAAGAVHPGPDALGALFVLWRATAEVAIIVGRGFVRRRRERRA
jgi:hypothetical protein